MLTVSECHVVCAAFLFQQNGKIVGVSVNCFVFRRIINNFLATKLNKLEVQAHTHSTVS